MVDTSSILQKPNFSLKASPSMKPTASSSSCSDIPGPKTTPVTPAGQHDSRENAGSCWPAAVLATPSITTKKGPEDEGWVSERQSDSEARHGKENKKKEMDDDDSEPKVKKLKYIKDLTGDDNLGITTSTGTAVSTVIGSSSHQSRQEFDESDNDGEGSDDDDYDNKSDDDDDDDDYDYSDKGGVRYVAAAAPGSTCHSCRQRSSTQKLQCSRCPYKFCGLCLRNRNGEQLEVEGQKSVKWVCPKCRGGCGPACNNCCICAPCRKSQGLAATGRNPRDSGFSNVHDYIIHCQTGESPEMISKRKEGRGWTKAGGAGINSTGFITDLLEKQQQSCSSTKAGPASSKVEPWNKLQAAQAWTNSTEDFRTSGIWKSPTKRVKRKDGDLSGATMLSGSMHKPANPVKGLKSYIFAKHNKDDNKQSKLLNDQVQERRAPTKTHISLDQIIERLLYPKVPRCCNTGIEQAKQGSVIQQVKRNKKHRKLFRTMIPTVLQNHKQDDATKVHKVVLENHGHGQQALEEATQLEKPSTSLQTLQKVHNHDPDPESLNEPIQLKRPVTSLQALRKMGILAKHDDADRAIKEPLQKLGQSTITPTVGHFNQALKEDVQMAAPLSPPPTSPDSGLQAILARYQERRKKMVVHSCLKAQNPVPVKPASEKPTQESIITWRGELRQNQSQLQAGFGIFSETRSVTGFELPCDRGLQSGFESFSHKTTLIGFGSVRGEETGLAASTNWKLS